MCAEDFRTFSIQGVDGLMHLRCGFPHLADSFANEQEVLGIDVACSYEATGLLGTSAGVRVVISPHLPFMKLRRSRRARARRWRKLSGVISKSSAATVSLAPKMAPRIKVKRCSRSRQRSIPEVQEIIASVTSRSVSGDALFGSASSNSGVLSSAAP